MKHFSEAIRDGAKKRPQCLDGWSDVNDKGEATSCAAVAGLEDLGIATLDGGNVDYKGTYTNETAYDPRAGAYHRIVKITGPVGDLMYNKTFKAPCGCLSHVDWNVLGIIIHLNDEHEWTREAISEWVETVERKLGLWNEEKKEEGQKEVLCTEVAPWDSVFDGSKIEKAKKG